MYLFSRLLWNVKLYFCSKACEEYDKVCNSDILDLK